MEKAVDIAQLLILPSRTYFRRTSSDVRPTIRPDRIRVPNGNTIRGVPSRPALLQLDSMFDSIRNDPRFQKLALSAPKTANKERHGFHFYRFSLTNLHIAAAGESSRSCSARCRRQVRL